MLNQESGGLKTALARWCDRVSRVVGAVCVLWVVAAGSVDGADDGWMTNFQEAEAAAKKAGVPMVVHFWAPWCGPCRNMEAEVLHSADVQAMLGKGIIGVKVNSDEQRELVSRFGVTALPTDVFVSVDGKVLSRSVGSPGRQGYLAKLNQYRAVNNPAAPSKAAGTAIAGSNQKSAAPQNVEVQTVTAAKPVFENVEPTPEKSIVGLSVSTEEAIASAKTETEKKPSDADASLPAAKNKALRKLEGLRMGLNGYSPVALTETTKWQKGESQFAHDFEGVRYLLSSAVELEKFQSAPEKFIPILHGCDPVSLVNDQVVQSGFVELGATFRSRMYFFTTKKSRDEFLSSPEKFATAYQLAFFESEKSADNSGSGNSAETPATETSSDSEPADASISEPTNTSNT